MTAQPTPPDFARDWFEQVWNERDETTIDRLVRPEFTIVSRRSEETTCIRGPEEFNPFLWALLAAIPDFKLTINKIVANDDGVALEFVCGGILAGTSNRIPLSRRQIRITGIAGGWVKNGGFVDGWVELDMVPLNPQIGEIMRSRVEQRFEASQHTIR